MMATNHYHNVSPIPVDVFKTVMLHGKKMVPDTNALEQIITQMVVV